MRWTLTDADRDSNGRIWVTPPARTLADLLPAAPEPEGETQAARPRWRPSRLELASIAAGLVLAVALIGLIQSFTPRPAPRSVPTAAPAPTSAPTMAPTRTPLPTATPAPTLEPPTPEPPPEPVIIIQAPPCDPLNPPYQVRQQVGDLGHVVGFSCSSVEEAQANADRLAAEMRATAEGR